MIGFFLLLFDLMPKSVHKKGRGKPALFRNNAMIFALDDIDQDGFGEFRERPFAIVNRDP